MVLWGSGGTVSLRGGLEPLGGCQRPFGGLWAPPDHSFPPPAGVDFGYEGQELLFRNLDFGIDMESRGETLQKDRGGGGDNGGALKTLK